MRTSPPAFVALASAALLLVPTSSPPKSGGVRLAAETPTSARPRSRVTFLPDGAESGPGATFVARGPGFAAAVSAGTTVVAHLAPKWDDERVRASLRDPSLHAPRAFPPRPTRPVQVEMLDADADAPVAGEERLAYPTNVYLGDDSAKWRTGVPSFERLRCRGAWPGVDVVWHGGDSGLEFDFVVAPGADPGRIAFRASDPSVETSNVRLDERGDLVVGDGRDAPRLTRPVVYQERDGARVPVEGRYVCDPPDAKGRVRVAFALGAYDRSREVVIDPTSVCSVFTYVGNPANDAPVSVAFLKASIASSRMVVNSPQLWVPGAVGGTDVAVIDYGPTGDVLRQSVIGSPSDDTAYAATPTADGGLFVAGITYSTAFTTTGGAYAGNGSASPYAFTVRFNADGTLQTASRYSFDGPFFPGSLALDAAGDLAVFGTTTATNLPTLSTAAFQHIETDGFGGRPGVLIFGAALDAVARATYFGLKSGSDAGVARLSNGDFAFAFSTSDTSPPTTSLAPQTTNAGGTDVYAVVMDPDFTTERLATLGGGPRDDFGAGVVADPSEPTFFVYGGGASQQFALPLAAGVSLPTNPGGNTGYVFRFDPRPAAPAPGQLVALIGGPGNTLATAGDAAGTSLIVLGYSDAFPTWTPVDPTSGLFLPTGNRGASDLFRVTLDFGPGGVTLRSSQMTGGNGFEIPQDVHVVADGSGGLVEIASAVTNSTDLHLIAPWQTANAGGDDVLVARIVTLACPQPGSPRVKTVTKHPRREGKADIGVSWSYAGPPVDQFVVEEAVVASDDEFPQFRPIATLQESPPASFAVVRVSVGGTEKHIYRVTAINKCGVTAGTATGMVVFGNFKPSKPKATPDGIDFGYSGPTTDRPDFDVPADLDFTVTGEQAAVTLFTNNIFGFLGVEEDFAERRSSVTKKLSGRVFIPRGADHLLAPFDVSLLPSPVKVKLTVAINGKSKTVTLKLRPPKKPK